MSVLTGIPPPPIRLRADIGILDKGTSLDVKSVSEYREKVKQVQRMKREVILRAHCERVWFVVCCVNFQYLFCVQIEEIVGDLEVRLESCEMAITKAPSLEIDDILQNAQKLFDMSKQIPHHNVRNGSSDDGGVVIIFHCCLFVCYNREISSIPSVKNC